MLCLDLTTSDFFPPAWVVGRSRVEEGVGVGGTGFFPPGDVPRFSEGVLHLPPLPY